MAKLLSLMALLSACTEHELDLHNWGERSEPHTCGENGKLSIYLYIYIYIWYVRIPYMHSALFVRDAIFLHYILGSCITACSRDKTRKAEQWESTQQGFENGEERRKGRHY